MQLHRRTLGLAGESCAILVLNYWLRSIQYCVFHPVSLMLVERTSHSGFARMDVIPENYGWLIVPVRGVHGRVLASRHIIARD